MDWLTYLSAAVVLIGSLALGFAFSGLWIGWWRRRHWPHED